jgi:hypothetical protein
MWRDRLAQAVESGSYVGQRLVQPIPEIFPSAPFRPTRGKEW